MKLFNIMMFLVVFNVAIGLVSFINIYHLNTDGALPQDTSLEDIANPSSGMWVLLGQSIGALIAGALAGAVGGYYVARVPTAEGAGYGFFAVFIGLIFTNTVKVLWSIVNWVPTQYQGGVAIVVGLFLAMNGLLCAIGFLQLIRGGMSSYL